MSLPLFLLNYSLITSNVWQVNTTTNCHKKPRKSRLSLQTTKQELQPSQRLSPGYQQTMQAKHNYQQIKLARNSTIHILNMNHSQSDPSRPQRQQQGGLQQEDMKSKDWPGQCAALARSVCQPSIACLLHLVSCHVDPICPSWHWTLSVQPHTYSLYLNALFLLQ